MTAEHKVPTDPVDPAKSSLQGWRDLVESGRLDPARLALVVHATTLVTNAVIERKGAVTALLTTRGFRDLLTFGREQMYDIYDLFAPPAEPLAPRELRVEADERVDPRRRRCSRRSIPPQVVATLRPLVEDGVTRGRDRVPAQLSRDRSMRRAAARAIAEAFPASRSRSRRGSRR